jgi:ubiquinone/menaquinone biosynthesis C-methylase UbiE
MDRLTNAEELIDGVLDEPEVLAGNLRDLRRVNRLLGGVRLSRLAVDRLTFGAPSSDPGRSPDVLLIDVGTGGADIPVALLADARRRGRRLRIVAVDDRQEIIDAAYVARPGLASVPGLTLAASDGRSLPYPDRSFDIAHASLVIHHLEPADATALLAEMSRIARIGVVVNDLERGLLRWCGAWLIANLLTRNPYTRHDGPLSVRRAYTRREARELLANAGLRPVAELRDVLRHRYAIAAVRG